MSEQIDKVIDRGFEGWTEHEYVSYLKQADDTLALILTEYGVEHSHDECGVICKINVVEGLLGPRLRRVLEAAQAAVQPSYHSFSRNVENDYRQRREALRKALADLQEQKSND